MEKSTFILFLWCITVLEIYGGKEKKHLGQLFFNSNWNVCCAKGVMVIDLKGSGSYQGSVPGVSTPNFTPQSVTNTCGTMALLKVTFKPLDIAGYGCLRQKICDKRMLQVDLLLHTNRKDFIFNIGDSSTNNGYAGDASTQTNDAEIQGVNNSTTYYASDKCRVPKQIPPLQTILTDAIGPGVTFLRLYISNQYVRIQNNLGLDEEICEPCLFGLNGQSETEGSINYDIYVALNRVVAGTYRNGYGVCNAVIQWTCP